MNSMTRVVALPSKTMRSRASLQIIRSHWASKHWGIVEHPSGKRSLFKRVSCRSSTLQRVRISVFEWARGRARHFTMTILSKSRNNSEWAPGENNKVLVCWNWMGLKVHTVWTLECVNLARRISNWESEAMDERFVKAAFNSSLDLVCSSFSSCFRKREKISTEKFPASMLARSHQRI